MSSSLDLTDLELSIAKNQNVDKYTRVSSLILLAYEIIVTMEEEVKYFWIGRVSLVQAIFFLNRWNGLISAALDTLGFFYVPNLALCRYMGWLHQLSGWLTISLLDIILLVRVVALYEKRQIISIFLSVLFVIEETITLFLLLHIEMRLDFSVESLTKSNPDCSAGGFLFIWATGFWIPPMVYQFTTLCLVLGKAKSLAVRRTRLESRLISVIVQDQVLYFLAVLVSGCASIVAYWIDDDYFRGAASGFAYAIPCIIGSRLLVNLKEVGEQDSSNPLGGTRGTLSGMVFGVMDTSSDGGARSLDHSQA